MPEFPPPEGLLGLTADIVAAFVSNNAVRTGEVAKLITDTYSALAGLSASESETPAQEFRPAVSVNKSLAKREVILSMIDGKPYKTLKRHLSTRGLTPDDYRARYNLPKDYPMVAPAYSEARRETAKRLGLGGKRKAGARTRASAGSRTKRAGA